MTTQADMLTVLVGAIRTYVPSDYDVKCMPGQGGDPTCGGSVFPYHADALANDPLVVRLLENRPRLLRVPCPESAECLFIALHEVGHLATEQPGNDRDTEFRASTWARQFMEERGVPVPEGIWAQAMDLAEQHRQTGFHGTVPSKL